jgi:UPF0755 protein
MVSMLKIVRSMFRVWFVGVIFLLAIFGYILYSCIWVIRYMQTRKRSFLPLSVVIILLLFGTVYYLFLPIDNSTKNIELIIPRNASVRQIADSLKQRQVITSKNVFLLWLKVTGTERKIQAGRAVFFKGDGIIRAAHKLQNTMAIEFTVTIPEGLTIEQTAKRVYDAFHLIDTVQFTALCKDSSFIKRLKIHANSLEGYLFPETYRFPNDVTAKDIIRKMVQSFESAYLNLQPNSFIAQKFTKNQIITIASIVEKEAALSSEQPRIAAVFHNRIKLGYPLGADPTVRYALKKFNGPLTVSDLNNSSPYNTRKFAGIPPGPICSPGKGALQAAISPADTKELYFVAKWDGSGAHDFSLTNEEHNRKKMAIRLYNDLRKKNEKPLLAKGPK